MFILLPHSAKAKLQVSLQAIALLQSSMAYKVFPIRFVTLFFEGLCKSLTFWVSGNAGQFSQDA